MIYRSLITLSVSLCLEVWLSILLYRRRVSKPSFKTTMDGYTQALEAPKRQAQAALANLIMRTGKVGHA
jgi:hypothetical protein